MNTRSAHKLFTYPLTVGLPHTNLNRFSEVQLLVHAGHFQWNSLAAVVGRPLSRLQTRDGFPIYATFFYIEEEFPASRPLSHFRLDQKLSFFNRLRHFKGMAIDGEMTFDEADRWTPETTDAFAETPEAVRGERPFLRLCNVFIAREGNNEYLKICPPEDCSFDDLQTLDPQQNIYAATRQAAKDLAFDLFDPSWQSLDQQSDFAFDYAINPDRDTNGAGLVYFAQYVAFLDMAERAALRSNSRRALQDNEINFRSLERRKLAYYGNVDIQDTLQIRVSLFGHADGRLGFRYQVYRKSDHKLIALSEAIKHPGPLEGRKP